MEVETKTKQLEEQCPEPQWTGRFTWLLTNPSSVFSHIHHVGWGDPFHPLVNTGTSHDRHPAEVCQGEVTWRSVPCNCPFTWTHPLEPSYLIIPWFTCMLYYTYKWLVRVSAHSRFWSWFSGAHGCTILQPFSFCSQWQLVSPLLQVIMLVMLLWSLYG